MNRDHGNTFQNGLGRLPDRTVPLPERDRRGDISGHRDEVQVQVIQGDGDPVSSSSSSHKKLMRILPSGLYCFNLLNSSKGVHDGFLCIGIGITFCFGSDFQFTCLNLVEKNIFLDHIFS